jgi:hypothetical protein
MQYRDNIDECNKNFAMKKKDGKMNAPKYLSEALPPKRGQPALLISRAQ